MEIFIHVYTLYYYTRQKHTFNRILCANLNAFVAYQIMIIFLAPAMFFINVMVIG